MTYEWQELDAIPVWAAVAVMAGIEPEIFNDYDLSEHAKKSARFWPIAEAAILAGKLRVCQQAEELRGVYIDTDSFRAWAGGKGFIGANYSVVYRSHYMEVMDTAIKHFALSDTNQGPKVEVIQDWILDRLKGLGDPSLNKAKMMATLIRQPESQRGGNKRQ